MHEIEPFYNWRDYYVAEEDKLSPFYGRKYSELYFNNRLYNYVIHPQWDNFGSSSMFCKLLFTDYEQQFCVIELIGEWNDVLHNDIMEFRKSVIDPLMENGILKFLLIGENVLNFHADDSSYYEDWYEEICAEGGWIVALNFRSHLMEEMRTADLDSYIFFGDRYNDFLWRKLMPVNLMEAIESLMLKKLG